jgi:hypothetical protein
MLYLRYASKEQSATENAVRKVLLHLPLKMQATLFVLQKVRHTISQIRQCQKFLLVLLACLTKVNAMLKM